MALTENFQWFTPDPTDRLVDLPDHLSLLASLIDSRVGGLPWLDLNTVDGANIPNAAEEMPQYRIKNGVCYLRGRVTQPAGVGHGLVIIPPEAIPYSPKWFAVTVQGGTSLVRLSFDNATRWLNVDNAISGTGASANLVSLYGISWPLD